MSYYGGYYGDPTTDPRFEVDGKFDAKDEDDKLDDEREKDLRNDDLLDKELERDREDKQMHDAYELVRANLSYDDYRQLQAEIRGGRVTNQDIMEMAKKYSIR
ncbi:hypothetical protein [Thomasclavelia cocleata]|jgi:hypothetical protein|uniref:hypothetical protein n=1 Tax=Thomasclavelia cocleata TaxID=69824 RepID=UPI00256F5E3F|nr:hypothetical protein [Thomasclavelia cocleata]